MNKLMLILWSRTFWTIAIIVAMNTLPQIKGHIPTDALDTITSILGALAVYFHITPSQNYSA